MATRNTTKRRWCIELGSGGRKERVSDNLPAPPGYCSNLTVSAETHVTSENEKLKIKKSWDLALSPIKGLPMNLFMLYMSGSSIGIFPIMIMGMMFVRPCKALLTTNATFSSVSGAQAVLLKMVFALGQLLQVGLALYKCQSLGLLPTHASDWLAFQEPANQVEFSYGGAEL